MSTDFHSKKCENSVWNEVSWVVEFMGCVCGAQFTVRTAIMCCVLKTELSFWENVWIMYIWLVQMTPPPFLRIFKLTIFPDRSSKSPKIDCFRKIEKFPSFDKSLEVDQNNVFFWKSDFFCLILSWKDSGPSWRLKIIFWKTVFHD